MTTPSTSQTSTAARQAVDLKKVEDYLIKTLTQDLQSANLPETQLLQAAEQRVRQLFVRTGLQLAPNVQDALLRSVLNEVIGYGPIEPLLADQEITEVMVNGPKFVYIERKGRIEKSGIEFENDDHVLRVIQRIVAPLGRNVDRDHPTVDARLPDGSRVNAVIPPVALDGPSITIRKFGKHKLTVEQLIHYGSITKGMVDFLEACVVARLNILISGGTGSGKTTLLNVLSSFIPPDERIVTIEDAAELRLHQEHIVRLETKPANPAGDGQVTIRDLVRNSLRMRPDRIVVGEVRGGEALDMLQAMNTGHDGSLTTLHANTPRDAVSRLETMTLMSGLDLPIRVVREQIASAVDLIVQQTRLRDGSRKVTQITELSGMEGDTVVLTDIFKFEQTGVTEEGQVLGELKPTGIRPMFTPRLEAAGFNLKPEIFGVNIAEILASNRRPGGRSR